VLSLEPSDAALGVFLHAPFGFNGKRVGGKCVGSLLFRTIAIARFSILVRGRICDFVAWSLRWICTVNINWRLRQLVAMDKPLNCFVGSRCTLSLGFFRGSEVETIVEAVELDLPSIVTANNAVLFLIYVILAIGTMLALSKK
jgi:hypothetical protein